MERMPFHEVLGSTFLNHPPQKGITLSTHPDAGGASGVISLRCLSPLFFTVISSLVHCVPPSAARSAALLAGVPSTFDCEDEPYIVELTIPKDDPSLHVFMTFQCSDAEARPGGPPPADNW